MTTIAIVDVGLGNVGSVANMFKKIGADATRVAEPGALIGAERVVLPGVGSFDVAMGRLQDGGWVRSLKERVSDGTPLLGICLGMQLLADGSEEGNQPGLGLVPGRVRRLQARQDDRELPVPHMGWNTADAVRENNLFSGLDADARFYFVHSYALVPEEESDVLAETVYGSPFVSAVARDNVRGVQFHPEKSHRHGMALLRGFLKT